MSDRQADVPPLPHKVRFAIQSFRQVKPNQALEQRLWNALEASEQTSRSPRKAEEEEEPASRRSRLPFVLALAGCFTAVLLVILVGTPFNDSPGKQIRRFEELAVQLPDTGHTWVELPLRTAHHPEGTARVSLDAPASVALHVSDGRSQEELDSDCTQHRCVHNWETPTPVGPGSTTRVRIEEPGRYEFAVTHSSDDLSYHERFVVVATR